MAGESAGATLVVMTDEPWPRPPRHISTLPWTRVREARTRAFKRGLVAVVGCHSRRTAVAELSFARWVRPMSLFQGGPVSRPEHRHGLLWGWIARVRRSSAPDSCQASSRRLRRALVTATQRTAASLASGPQPLDWQINGLVVRGSYPESARRNAQAPRRWHGAEDAL